MPSHSQRIRIRVHLPSNYREVPYALHVLPNGVSRSMDPRSLNAQRQNDQGGEFANWLLRLVVVSREKGLDSPNVASPLVLRTTHSAVPSLRLFDCPRTSLVPKTTPLPFSRDHLLGGPQTLHSGLQVGNLLVPPSPEQRTANY